MKVLLDTHVWVWAECSPEKFGKSMQVVLKDPTTQVYVSPISSLEISQLIFCRKLDLKVELTTWIKSSLLRLHAETLEFSHEVAAMAYAFLEKFHKDPADRVLVSTARSYGVTLLTVDTRILDSGLCPVLDASR